MRQSWFDRVDDMLRTVEESMREQWDCPAIEALFEEKVSTSYTIMSAIGPSPQDGHGNRRSVSTRALKEFLREFQKILESAPRRKAIEDARLLFKQRVKPKAFQKPECTERLETGTTDPSLSSTPASEYLNSISKEQASGSSIAPVAIANQVRVDLLYAQKVNAAESAVPEDCKEESLCHANWCCTYYIAFVPRAQFLTHYEKYRSRLSTLLKELAQQKHCKCESGAVAVDHVFIVISVPPYAAVTSVANHLRERSSLRMMEGLKDSELNGRGRSFWAREYFAPLGSFELDAIRNLMAKELGRINGRNGNVHPG